MQYFFAPMEGLTDHAYRRLHHKYFAGVDRYYMPFLSPTMHRTLSHKEQRELPPADSVPFTAVPQILTRNAGDFLWAARTAADLGYREVNLNLGCPSGTVVAKGKGAGLLRDVWELDAFLEEVFSGSPLPISVKTRLGLESSEEFPALLEVFNRYPILQLQVHPRVRKAFYAGNVDLDMFRYCLENSTNPLCYNGDLFSSEDISNFSKSFPAVDTLMLGRGLVGDPGMLSPGGTDPKTLQAFMEELLETYMETFGGSRNAMFRMKENWSYLLPHFTDSEKLGKRLRKTTDLTEYKSVTKEIFDTLSWEA